MNKDLNLYDNNIEFTKLKDFDLKDIIKQINKYYLEYRYTLNLPSKITFGTEIEYEEGVRKLVDKYIQYHLIRWKSSTDGSLTSGGEVISPIMKDKDKYWFQLQKICKFLTSLRVDTCHNAAGHIHVGAHIMGDINSWRKFLKLYTIYEPVLFRFFYGDKINARKTITDYASPLANDLYKIMKYINEAKSINDLQYYFRNFRVERAINLNYIDFYNITQKNDLNTIEFRSPNATTNEVIWQNNINAITKMLLACINNNIDEEYLDYKLKNSYIPYQDDEFKYNKIDLDEVFKFIDTIFDNTLDKVYFLRQYIKDYKVNIESEEAIMSKKITK